MQTVSTPMTPHSAPPSTFGTRLAAARRAAGLTQEQLARGMGTEGRDLVKGSISSWEQDGSQPSAAQIALICQRLGISSDRLLGLENEG